MIDSIHVLHVDDDPDMAGLVATFLEREDENITVHSVTSVDEALTYFAAEAVDCIVSDYEMPGTNGIEFLKSIRETEPEIPFILYTGKGSEDIASDAISAGVTDYLQKERGTGQYTLLANRIRNAVERYDAQAELRSREKRLNLYFEQSPLGGVQWDLDWNFVRVNESARALLGYEKDELVGQHIGVIMPEESRDDIIETLRSNLFEDDQRYHHNINKNVRKDGTIIECEWHNWVVEDDTDEVVAVYSKFRDITDEKAKERELRRTKRRYETILAHASDYLMIVDEAGRVSYISPAVEHVLGYDPAAVTGANAFDFVHPDDHEIAAEAMSTALEDAEEVVNVEYRAQAADGSYVWIEVRGRNFFDQPDIAGILASVRNITERKERERRYDAIFNQSYQLTGLLEPDGTLIEANQTALDFGSLDRDAVIGMKLWETYSFQHSDETKTRVREAVMKAASGEFVRHELPIQDVDGAEVIIDFSIRPVTDEEGEVVLLIPEGRDITELKEREVELDTHKEHLEHLLQAVTRLYGAESAEECHNITIETAVSILGFDWCTLTAPAPDSEYFEIIAVSADAPVEVGDRPFKISEGVAGHVYQTKEPLITTDARDEKRGKPTSADIRSALTIPVRDWGVFQAVGTDVEAFDETDQRHAELLVTAMQTAIDRIESRADLARRNQRLQEFTSVVSHDLRNPLSVAQGRIELAAEECSSEHLDHAATSLERMATLIEDLLTLSEQGRRIGDTEDVSIRELTEQCWLTVDTADASLTIEGDVRMQADRSRLRQLIENLLRNAVQHGGSTVTVSIGPLSDGFYVEDTGSGIPPDRRDSIFTAGFSMDSAGTGFGLAIVKEIAEAHEWDIQIAESESGGARFEFTGIEIVD